MFEFAKSRARGPARPIATALLALILAGPGVWWLWAVKSTPSGPNTQIPYKVRQTWGLRGAQAGDLHYPRAIEAAADRTLFVIDRSGRIQRFAPDGELVHVWRLPAWDNGTPTGMSIDAEGRLAVANCHYSNILLYEPNATNAQPGQAPALRLQFGEYGFESGQLIYPTDVAMAKDGSYYVCQYGAEYDGAGDRVMKFDSKGRFLAEWGGFGPEPGQFQRPMALIIDDRNRIWVADAGNHRIQVFDLEGRLLQVIGGSGDDAGQFRYPYDLALGPDGQIVVAEYGNNRLQLISPDYQSLGTFGGPGREPGQFASPWGVSIDSQGWIWVADTLNHRIQALEIDWGKHG